MGMEYIHKLNSHKSWSTMREKCDRYPWVRPRYPRLSPGDLQYIQPTVIRNDVDFSCPEGIRLVPGAVHGLGR